MINKINKKGWVARDFIIAMLVFSGVLAMFVVMIGSVANDYNNTDIISPDFSDKFDKFSENVDTGGEMWAASTGEGGLSLFGTADLLFFSTFKVISLVFDSVNIAWTQMAEFGEFFGIPSVISNIFVGLIFTILTVMIVFIIISSIRSGKEL